GVDHEHALFAGLHGDVAARADEHVDVALRRQHLDFDGVEVLGLLSRERRDEADRHDRRTGPNATRHLLAPAAPRSFFRYSGYVVSAPPRAASGGTPCAFGYS